MVDLGRHAIPTRLILGILLSGVARSVIAAESHSALFEKADAVLMVTAEKKQSCDKYCWYDVTVQKILKGPEKNPLTMGERIKVAAYSGTPEPPMSEFMIFVQHYYRRPHLWKLIQDSKDKTWESAGTSCNARGGTFQKSCLMDDLTCVTPYTDGGKECTDRSQCLGGCFYERKEGELAPPPGTQAKGVCQRNDYPCGCFTAIENGKTKQGLCAD